MDSKGHCWTTISWKQYEKAELQAAEDVPALERGLEEISLNRIDSSTCRYPLVPTPIISSQDYK